MNGFVSLVKALLLKTGISESNVYCKKRVELPGWYRSEKK